MSQALEERIAHLTRGLEELSDVVARQSREIDRLSNRVALLLEREADRQEETGSVSMTDQRPPHW